MKPHTGGKEDKSKGGDSREETHYEQRCIGGKEKTRGNTAYDGNGRKLREIALTNWGGPVPGLEFSIGRGPH